MPPKTPALSSSSLLEGDFVSPRVAHKAHLHWVPHTSTFLLTDSRGRPSSLVKPACAFPTPLPFPHSVPGLAHAPLLLCKFFGLACGSLSWPSVIPTFLPHSTCYLIGLVSFASIPYGELDAPYMLDVDGSEKSIQSLAYFWRWPNISKANFLVLFKLAQQFGLVHYS